MIYTVTLNPAMDCVMQLDEFVTGRTNRASGAFYTAGGKGVNVSLVLRVLGINNIATGILAGFTGREIEAQLKAAGCASEFVMLKEGCTRINIKIKGREETEINGVSTEIGEYELRCMMYNLYKVKEGDTVVLAGSIPNKLPPETYGEIMRSMQYKKVNFVVDTEGEALLSTLQWKPFLIKPNNHELGAIFGCEINTPDKAAEYGEKLRQQGARNVLVSMAGDGAVLCAEDGKTYFQAAAKGEVVNSVGAGDSMVAGFIAGLDKYISYASALRLGTAAGAACAFSEGLPGYEDIMDVMNELE